MSLIYYGAGIDFAPLCYNNITQFTYVSSLPRNRNAVASNEWISDDFLDIIAFAMRQLGYRLTSRRNNLLVYTCGDKTLRYYINTSCESNFACNLLNGHDRVFIRDYHPAFLTGYNLTGKLVYTHPNFVRSLGLDSYIAISGTRRSHWLFHRIENRFATVSSDEDEDEEEDEDEDEEMIRAC